VSINESADQPGPDASRAFSVKFIAWLKSLLNLTRFVRARHASASFYSVNGGITGRRRIKITVQRDDPWRSANHILKPSRATEGPSESIAYACWDEQPRNADQGLGVKMAVKNHAKGQTGLFRCCRT